MHLYIIQSSNNGCFKVGRSNYPAKRLSQLQTGNPYKLKLILILRDQGHREKQIHRYITLGKKKKCKGEWFEFDLIANLPEKIYELLDLDDVNVWWSLNSSL
jgi:hypothetical protein